MLVEFVVAELLFWGANVFGFRDGRGVGRGACFRDASDAGEAVGPGVASFRFRDASDAGEAVGPGFASFRFGVGSDTGEVVGPGVAAFRVRTVSGLGAAVGPGFAFRIDDGRSRVGALVKDGRCCCSRIDELVNDF